MPDRVLALIKFGDRPHMEALIREGNLFMRPLAGFVALEQDSLRGDENEGLTEHVQAQGGEFARREADGTWQTMGTIAGPLRYRDPGSLNPSVFCMYALFKGQAGAGIDPQTLGFGGSFVLLTDADEFLRRVRASAIREGVKLDWGLVTYVDPATYSGPMGPFRKLLPFSYQSEFRLVVEPGNGKPLSLIVGNLEDIAILGRTREVNDRLRVENGTARFRVD